jgi:hypothetical protein
LNFLPWLLSTADGPGRPDVLTVARYKGRTGLTGRLEEQAAVSSREVLGSQGSLKGKAGKPRLFIFRTNADYANGSCAPEQSSIAESSCDLLAGSLRRRRLFRFYRFAAEPHRLGQFRASSGVIRRDHRIIRRQTPFGDIRPASSPWWVDRWRFSDLNFFPSSRQMMWSGVTDFLIDTAANAPGSAFWQATD